MVSSEPRQPGLMLSGRLLGDQTVAALSFTHPSKYKYHPTPACLRAPSDPADLSWLSWLLSSCWDQLLIAHSGQNVIWKLIHDIQPGQLLFLFSGLSKSAPMFTAAENRGAKSDSVSLLHCIEILLVLQITQSQRL